MSENSIDTLEIAVDDLFWQECYEPITENDEQLAQLVDQADLPALLAALAAATGNTKILAEELRPPLTPVDTKNHPHGGMSAEAVEKAKAVALSGLIALRDQQITATPRLDAEAAEDILGFLSNGHSEWNNMLKHELGLTPENSGAPTWCYEDVVPAGRTFKALIVGSGVAGIAAAHRFAQAGVPFEIIEASDRLGGTWQKNKYPGVRLDTPTFGYSYSFAQKADWPHQFAQGEEVRSYLQTVAEKAGLSQKIEYGAKLISATWDEAAGVWETAISKQGQETEVRHFNAVISASGQLDIPNVPEFPGQGKFTGIQMHSQEWDVNVDWRGKKVAVIGTGASAYQIVPAIYEEVAELVVFQRNAPWMLPAPTYHAEVSDTFAWLVRKVPCYAQWFRLWTTVLGIQGRFHTVRAEENWSQAPLSVSHKNHQVREELIGMLSKQFAGHPELLKHAIPSYPPGAKRMLRDNGVWAKALTAEHATLEVSPISEFTENGIVTADGTNHEVDIVIYATGFKPSDYLDGIEIVGREGTRIHDYWQGDARAHNGVTVPGFPNFFMVYGPNVGGVVAGSLHFMLERASEYALKAVHEVLKRDAKALDVTQAALDRFTAWVDAENRQMAWGQPYVRTWYQNRKGRVSQVWPFTNIEYWEATENVLADEYEYLN
ncbi:MULTISPECIES: flavin-containing monooxygenase [unclassified Glutamicibacter]|uniref:flavin-containing monooxygenase n=1 Tax=unclassified Glutamicibacter TaxID=2627139 RepID=UPI0038195A6E